MFEWFRTRPERSGLVSVQFLRAVAALGVVVFHLQPFEQQFLPGPTIAPRWFALGDIGVDLFFVISGFIIVESTSNWFDRRHAGQFLWRRLTRIYPIYWFYNLLLLAMFWLQPSVLSANRQAPDLLASFLLTPPHGKTLLLISWTLMYEVEFYLIFAACLFCMSRPPDADRVCRLGGHHRSPSPDACCRLWDRGRSASIC